MWYAQYIDKIKKEKKQKKLRRCHIDFIALKEEIIRGGGG